MRISPVNGYKGPKYPTRGILDEYPELLALVPKRWQASPVVLTALGTLCLLSAAIQINAKGRVSKPAVRVAPVFRHGEGRGVFGCVAVNPPVVLSEQDAREVIIDEAKKAGINLSAKGPELSDVLMENHKFDGNKTEQQKKKKLQLDGVDSKRHLAFEYVSEDEATEWSKPSGSTIDVIEPRKLAQLLRSRLGKTKQNGNYVIFYDPFEAPNYDPWNIKKPLTTKDIEKMRIKAEEKTRQQLRLQVKDFVKWLKAQGVI
jgi:hypothetical protein